MTTSSIRSDGDDTVSLGELFTAIARGWKLTAAATVLCGAAGFGIASVIAPIYTARTVIIPQRAKETSTASATNALSALAGVEGANVQSPAEQYVSLMRSATVSDRIIDQFKLDKVYNDVDRTELRERLVKNVLINVGLTNGMITIEVDDTSAKRAADMANGYVDALRFMTSKLALSEAQQRRKFFELQLEDARAKLTQAQIALQAARFAEGALQASPGQAAERYARLQAEESIAEMTLHELRVSFAPNAPEIVKQESLLAAMHASLRSLQESAPKDKMPPVDDFVERYREFKYREALFNLVARQFDLARGDEAREGALLQVVDPAMTPQRKSKPKRSLIAAGAAIAGLLGSLLYAVACVSRGKA